VNEAVARLGFQTLQVIQIPGVGEQVEVDHLNIFVFLQEVPNQVGTNESSTTGHE
jgi:hypothetical protein